jgi:hypothetical protein
MTLLLPSIHQPTFNSSSRRHTSSRRVTCCRCTGPLALLLLLCLLNSYKRRSNEVCARLQDSKPVQIADRRLTCYVLLAQ